MEHVVQELTRFLDALPEQVLAWDRKVIDRLSANVALFREFQGGGSAAKWKIYSTIRYGDLAD